MFLLFTIIITGNASYASPDGNDNCIFDGKEFQHESLSHFISPDSNGEM